MKLPASIEPFVKALLIKANSIVIYWEDIAYVRPSTNPSYKSFEIEPDLLVLKAQLEQWALQMQASPRRPYDSRDMNGNDVYSRGINSQGVNSKMPNKDF